MAAGHAEDASLLVAFNDVFAEVARRECQLIEARDPAGRPATFALIEMFCSDPQCDCKRAVLDVVWVEGSEIVASVVVEWGTGRGRRSRFELRRMGRRTRAHEVCSRCARR